MMQSNGKDLSDIMIPKTIKDLEEEAKILALALFKLMQNLPNTYVSISASNEEGEAVYLHMVSKDENGKDHKVDKNHFEWYAPDEWHNTYFAEGEE